MKDEVLEWNTVSLFERSSSYRLIAGLDMVDDNVTTSNL